MKLIGKLILTIISIPVFIIFLISISLRFQFLKPSFWEKSFDSGNVYSKLSLTINKNLETQVVAEGGRASDVVMLTDLITPGNLKETIDNNIKNILQFANGESPEIIVYIPVGKIPKSLLAKNFNSITEQMKLADFLKEFNMTGISSEQILYISRFGPVAWIILLTSFMFLSLLIFLLYLMVDSGKRLFAPGVALILSGIATFLITVLGTIIRVNWTKDLAGSVNTGDSIIGIIAPPVMQGVLSTWSFFAISVIILGIVLMFLKKPYYNRISK